VCRGAEWERLGGGTSVYVAERHPKNAAGEPQPQDHADNRHQEQASPSTDEEIDRYRGGETETQTYAQTDRQTDKMTSPGTGFQHGR